MMLLRLQIISIALLVATSAFAKTADIQRGHTYNFSLRDVDNVDLSTADGHVTIITVVTRENEEQARAIADQVPDRCIGDPKYRYITLVNFQRKLAGPFQGLTKAIIRNRLEAEADGLKAQYAAKKLKRNPRQDLFVIADFDGAAVSNFGLMPEDGTVAVFVFNGRGKLVNLWKEVPPGHSLADAIAAAER